MDDDAFPSCRCINSNVPRLGRPLTSCIRVNVYGMKFPLYEEANCSLPDTPECGDPTKEREWCWARGHCVEGVGGSYCACADGYSSSPPHGTECVREYWQSLLAVWNISIVNEFISP